MNAWALILGGVVLVVVGYWLTRLFIRRGAHVRPASGQAFVADDRAHWGAFTPRDYSPQNVGNDASARPWESGFGESPIHTQADEGWPLRGAPKDFDAEDFLRASKAHFVQLQEAWDRADVARLRSMMTDDMLQQIQAELAERERHTGDPASQTEVVMIEARLLGVEDLGDGHIASVEFSGLAREGGAGPSPFREVWSMARARAGGNWLVAGVQALQ